MANKKVVTLCECGKPEDDCICPEVPPSPEKFAAMLEKLRTSSLAELQAMRVPAPAPGKVKMILRKGVR